MSVVFLTESAKEQMSKMLEEHQRNAVKLALQGGGCAGFKYDWTLEDAPEKDDEVIDLPNGKFLIDSMSVMYLLGSTVDYKTSSCGCGESVGF